MRRIITHVIKLLLPVCVLAAGCTGCGDGTPGEEESYGIEALVPAEKEWSVLEQELRPCVLQVFCGDYRGSGLVWEITEEEVTVISSGHLLDRKSVV